MNREPLASGSTILLLPPGHVVPRTVYPSFSS